MVLAGNSEEKPENCRRAEYAGFVVNLEVGRPTAEMVAAAVNEVLTNPKYKTRAMELKKEAEDFKCFETIERELRALF
jgi:UDP:flavonoid glycosyltransferase YjiC (YdhE family)